MKLKQWAQDWFAAWQASHAGSYRTAQSYQGLLQNTILPRLGRFELTELTPPRLKRQSNSTAVFLFVDRKDSLVQSQERSPQGFQSPGRIFGRGTN